MISIGIDTSCYTTSVAIAGSGLVLFDKRRLLTVPIGNRGLRQSDAVYQHIRNLPELLEEAISSVDKSGIACVSVSERPVDLPGSFMPVFTVGSGIASILSASLGIPVVKTTHQCGHIRAAQIGNERLLSYERFHVMHLSGGTTDLLSVRQKNGYISGIENHVCSDDLHIGQFVDRVGVALGLPFPAGPYLEKLALQSEGRDLRIPSAVKGLRCSFSGAESCARRWISRGMPPAEIAYAVYDCMARTISKVIDECVTKENAPFLLAGGVASSGLFRELLLSRVRKASLSFGAPLYCADNACGTALIGLERMLLKKHE